MPDPGIQPPYLDPSQYPSYLDLQRKQMLAQMLMQGTQQASQTPPEWNSMRVVPRRSPLANIATLASALMAGKALKGSREAEQQYFQGLYGGEPQSPAPQVNAASAPSSAAPPADPTAQTAGPGLLPQPAPQNPLIPGGMARGTANALMGMMGPEKYAESLIAPQYKPTEMQQMLRAAGIDPASPLGQQVLQQAMAKANYVTPIEQRANSIERDPFSNAVIGVNPATPTGGVNLYDRAGNLTGQGLAPGAAATIEASEKAAQLGKTAGQYNVLPTAGGGSAVVGGPQGAAPSAAGGLQAPRVGQPAGIQPQPSAEPWASMPKLPVSSALGAPNEFVKGRLQEAGKKDAELSSKYGAEADLADQKQQYNAQAISVLPSSETGPLSSWLTENRAALIEGGMPAGLIPSSGKVAPTLELNKYLKNAALQGARQIYGSRMTQMEVKLQTDEMSPSSSMTRDAIASLIQQDNIRNGYSKQRAQHYGQFIQSGGDPLRFESWYANKFPLTAYAKATLSGPAPGSTPAPTEVAKVRQKFTAEEIQAELKRRRLGGG